MGPSGVASSLPDTLNDFKVQKIGLVDDYSFRRPFSAITLCSMHGNYMA